MVHLACSLQPQSIFTELRLRSTIYIGNYHFILLISTKNSHLLPIKADLLILR